MCNINYKEISFSIISCKEYLRILLPVHKNVEICPISSFPSLIPAIQILLIIHNSKHKPKEPFPPSPPPQISLSPLLCR